VRKGSVYRRSGGWAFRLDIAADPETGRRRQRSQQGFRTKVDAVAAMNQVMADHEPPRIWPSDPLSIRQVARGWLERKTAECTPSTMAAYRRSVGRICDRFGDLRVGDLTVAMVDEFEHDLLDNGAAGGGVLSAKSVEGVHAVFDQLLDDAVRRGAASSNVAASAAPPRHEDDVITVWTPDEVRAFLGSVRGHRLFPAFFVLLATGLTRGELVGLRWADVDLDTGEITIRRIVSMTNGQRTESVPSPSARRTVSIAQRTVDVLDERRAEVGSFSVDQPVFEKRGGGELNPESLSNTFRRLVEHAGVSPITIAGLRHTHAALLFRAGVSPLVVSKRLGHSTFATTQDMYGHLIPPLRDPHLESFEQSILESQP
jgi:integrase